MLPYQKIISQAIEHVKEQQLPDGSFLSLSSTDPKDFSSAFSYKTTFFTANILVTLDALTKSPLLSSGALNDLREIQQKGATFLLTQRSENWSFNYFTRGDDDKIISPYPDDLDDTFVALAAIAHHEPKKIDGGALAMIVQLLVNREVREGGPFKTWLVPQNFSKSWQDIDVVVNSNVGYFLSLIDVQIPNIQRFIAQAIEDGSLKSPYYPGLYQVIYFISRFCKSQKEIDPSLRAGLARILTDPEEQRWPQRNTLEQAIAISSFINLGEAGKIVPRKFDSFVASLEKGAFKPHAFCIDPKINGERAYAGASALTAALCVEAIVKYMLIGSISISNEGLLTRRQIHNHIQNLAREESKEVMPELRTIALEQIEKTSDEKIALIAYETQKILELRGNAISTVLTENLALANLYGWMAYTIYDDLIDSQGDAAFIPCANFFLRKLVEIYDGLDKNISGAHELFNTTMNIIDNAMAWEQAYCRISIPLENVLTQNLPDFKEYDNLADRSIGHALPTLIALLSIGYDAKSEEHNTMMEFFRHYLIARQLHDDAHDWEEDLLRGHINSVCALLLKNFQKKYYGKNKIISLIEALPELRKIFWEEIIDEAVNFILAHLKVANEAKVKSVTFGTTNFMGKALQDLYINAQKAFHDRDQALEFLKYYGPNFTYSENSSKPLSYK